MQFPFPCHCEKAVPQHGTVPCSQSQQAEASQRHTHTLPVVSSRENVSNQLAGACGCSSIQRAPLAAAEPHSTACTCLLSRGQPHKQCLACGSCISARRPTTCGLHLKPCNQSYAASAHVAILGSILGRCSVDLLHPLLCLLARTCV